MPGETVIMENNSSPHKVRNYQGVVNAVLVYLNTEKTTRQVAVLVEGPDDVKVYRKFFDQNMTQLFSCIGKGDLQKALSELLDKTNHVIGIRDADFSNLENAKPAISHLFFTDYHDLEMTILYFEEVRRSLFSEYGDLNRIDSVWKTIIKDASFAGYIRWFNEKNDYQIVFDGLFYKIDSNGDREQVLLDQLNRVVQKLQFLNNFRLKTAKCLAFCKTWERTIRFSNKSNEQSPDKKGTITKELVHDFITEHNTDDIFNLCNGHDVSDLLVMAFKINTKQLATALRLSFYREQFIKTALYRELLAWQTDCDITILYSSLEGTAHNV